MIDRIILWSIRHRWFVIACALVLACAGVWAMRVAAIDAIPDLSENQVIVSCEWPGHGPVETEQQITAPLTRALLGVPGVKTIRSSSDVGRSSLWVILEEGVSTPRARQALSERLTEAAAALSLPDGVVPRLAPDGPATGQVFWYTLESDADDLATLRSLHDRLIRPALSSVPGVAEVASVGGALPEIVVEADPARLRSRGVDLLDLVRAVGEAGRVTGAGGLNGSNAEALVRTENAAGTDATLVDPGPVLREIGLLAVPALDGSQVLVDDVADVRLAAAPRRGVLEKDGREVCGGVVLMRYGENPLRLTERLKARLRELLVALPPQVRLVVAYDRTPLIEGAVETISRTIIEAMIIAAACVMLLLLHVRAALVVTVTLPLSILSSFLALELLRRLGIADIPLNVMSLAGLSISIGVLVDSAIVMTENVLHVLHEQFGDGPITGDLSAATGRACRQVGRPMVLAIVIMLLSFLPIFVLGGMEGKMFRPLAATKTLAMVASAVLAITLVPAMASLCVRGRARGEHASRFVRGVMNVYRPVLAALLDRPGPIVWIVAATCVAAAAMLGHHGLFLLTLGTGFVLAALTARGRFGRIAGPAALVLLGLAADTHLAPLGHAFLTPLDEQMVMDMPITVPRVTIAQGIDDLKARDMVLCRFPEVAMVVGKLGRAETPTDPAPLDMIESMVELHPRSYWPERMLDSAPARSLAGQILALMTEAGLITLPPEPTVASIAEAARHRLHQQLGEFCYQRNRMLFRSPEFDETRWKLNGLSPAALERWRARTRTLNAELRERAAGLFARLVIEESLRQSVEPRSDLRPYIEQLDRFRTETGLTAHHAVSPSGGPAMSRSAEMPAGLAPVPELDAVQEAAAHALAGSIRLRRALREELIGFGGAFDQALQMPGWTNVWTMPIQNRVDMLATGVNTTIGIRVMGNDLDAIVDTSEAVAEVVRSIPGAVGVVCDPVRGKPTIQVRTERDLAARLGVPVGETDRLVAAAMEGTVPAHARLGPERVPIRVRYDRAHRVDENSIEQILVKARPLGRDRPLLVPLGSIATVQRLDGPATLKGENAELRNYVRLNVRDRDTEDFLREARARVASEVAVPAGCRIEWTGQFEHEIRARQALLWIVPVVVLVIGILLYVTFHDIADAGLVLLAIPGVIAGGIVFQWFVATPMSITVWVGYIACFGMATATGVIMLVYLRDAIEKRGGLGALDQPGLRQAVIEGAAHRLRPKLLTELTTVISLIPLFIAGGVGSEVIRPMVAPVIGGILVADEVIDLLLPVLFYRVRLVRWARLQRGRPAAVAQPDRPPDAA